jgi:SAM-dependent methyltransferase
LDARLKCRACGRKFGRKQGFPMLLPSSLPEDMRLSIEAWDKEWATLQGAELRRRWDEYTHDYLDDTLSQLLDGITVKTHPRYLEIGCGACFLGEALARRGFQVAGVECCVEALKVARQVHRKDKRRPFFVGGDLNHLPMRDASVDFLYGGGVIEHFEDTLGAVRELARVLRPGGRSFNTVPYFSLASLSYRQLWGNIPDLPVLKGLFEFVHLRLLGGRHMRYGYEKSFTAAKMRAIHLEAGFSKVEIFRFKVFLPLYFMPGPLKALARRLTQWRPFWPMIAVVATK